MSVASRAIFSNFFEEQSTQNHPQYLSVLSRALFPTTFLEIAVYVHKHVHYQVKHRLGMPWTDTYIVSNARPLAQVIAWFVAIFGINITSYISKLLYEISRAVR